jgi:hypothetical protein
MNATSLSKRNAGQAIGTTGVNGRLAGITRVIVLWLVLLSLTGCATPTTFTTAVAGIEITEHLDAKMPPGCEQAFPTGGCYQLQEGKHNIWYSEVSLPYVRKHEIAHALGMQHSMPWSWDGEQSCATVTVSGGGHMQGQRICVDSHGEHTEGVAYANNQVGR